MDTGGVEPWAYLIVGGVQLATHSWMSDPRLSRDELIDYLTMLCWNALCGDLSRSADRWRSSATVAASVADRPAGRVIEDRSRTLPGMPEVSVGSRLKSWAYALRTTNPPPDGPIDAVTRWLVVTRAAVLPMTLVSGLVAALLAVGKPGLDWRWLVLAVLGITLAHTANNLMNDLYDTQVGTDSASYPRALYAHAPGAVRADQPPRTLGHWRFSLVNIQPWIWRSWSRWRWARGWPVVAFALSGFALSVAYTAPPLRLKKRGLGEPDVFVVWGPLMVCGTYYSAVGAVGWDIVLASLPYGLLCARSQCSWASTSTRSRTTSRSGSGRCRFCSARRAPAL